MAYAVTSARLDGLFPRIGQRASLELGRPGTGRRAGVIRRLDDREVVGSFELEPSRTGLLIRSLCVEAPFRGHGLGSEAAHLLREAAEAGPWVILRAWAPPDRGLAVYFWSRMGLRPLFGEGPAGGIWFERPVR